MAGLVWASTEQGMEGKREKAPTKFRPYVYPVFIYTCISTISFLFPFYFFQAMRLVYSRWSCLCLIAVSLIMQLEFICLEYPFFPSFIHHKHSYDHIIPKQSWYDLPSKTCPIRNSEDHSLSLSQRHPRLALHQGGPLAGTLVGCVGCSSPWRLSFRLPSALRQVLAGTKKERGKAHSPRAMPASGSVV